MFRRAAGFRKRGHARIARRPKKQTARGATPAVRQYRAGTPKADRGGNAGFEITRTNQGRRRDKGPIRAAGLLRQDQSLMRTGMRTGTRRPCALVPGPPMTPANVAAHTHANNTARETTVKPATISNLPHMGSLWQKHGADTIPRVEEAMFPAQERRIRGVSDFLLKLK